MTKTHDWTEKEIFAYCYRMGALRPGHRANIPCCQCGGLLSVSSSAFDGKAHIICQSPIKCINIQEN